jgi:hypothetical protein
MLQYAQTFRPYLITGTGSLSRSCRSFCGGKAASVSAGLFQPINV